jgi:hypothetical protein
VPDLIGNGLEYIVAGLVTVLVVHQLEAVKVEKQHREPLVAPFAALDLEGQALAQHPIGRESGELVGRGRAVRFFRPALLVRRTLPHRRPP